MNCLQWHHLSQAQTVELNLPELWWQAVCSVTHPNLWPKCRIAFISGHRVEEPDVGGPAERAGAASWEQPAREGSLSQEPALAAGAARQQDLWADGAAGHPGQDAGEQLEGATPQPSPPPRSPAGAQSSGHLHVGTHIVTDTRQTTWILSVFLSTCIRYVQKEYVYTQLDALPVHTFLLRYAFTYEPSKAALLGPCLPSAPLWNILKSLTAFSRFIWWDADFFPPSPFFRHFS